MKYPKRHSLHKINFYFVLCFSFLSFNLLSQTVTLVSPKNNFFLNKKAVQLKWDNLAEAVSYDLQIARDSNFTTLFFSNSNIIEDYFNATALLPGEYYWKVRYFDGKNYSNWSAICKFSFFNPSNISGLKFWVKSDTGVVSSSNNVSVWKDLSGNANDASQNLSDLKPVYVSNVLNGYAGIRFDDANDALGTPLNINADSFSISILYNYRSNVSGQARAIQGSNNWLLGPFQGTYSLYAGNFINGKTVEPFQFVYQTILQNSSTLMNYVNGKFYGSIINPSYPGKVGVSADGFATTQSINGDVPEIIIYNKFLTDALKNKVENYINDKYAPPIDLGANKIVCSFPYVIYAKKEYYTKYVWQDNSTADSLVVNTPGIYYITATNVFEKNTSDTVIIGYDNLPFTVNLGKDTTICAGTILNLKAGLNHLSYKWSTGDTSNIIKVNTSGIYHVAVTDCLGNVSSDTINVIVNPLPFFNLGVDTVICSNSNFVLNPNISNSQYLTFEWFDGTQDSIHSVKYQGVYSLTISDKIGCTYADSIKIGIDSLAQSISLGADTTFCSGNAIYLKKGASQAVSYLWSTNSVNDTLVITTSGKYWLTVKSINNCLATDTIIVIVSGSAPTANFSNTAGICLGKSMQFNDLSTAAAGNTIVSWAWDFGDSQITTQQNPMHVYLDTGSFKVILNIITDGGCSNQLSKVVKVYPYPQVAIFASNACEQSRVQFSSTLLTFGYPITKWAWNFADPSSGGNNFSTLQNPTHLYSAQGNYQAQLIIQNSFGCADTAITTLNIKPKPTADFNYSYPCKNDSVHFTNSSLLPTASSLQKIYWNFGDNTTSLLIKPKHKYASAVSYNASLIVTASNGCSDTARKTIAVNDNPIAYFSTSNACVNSPVNFNDFSVISNGTITNWLWEIDSTMLSNLKDPSYTFNKVGNANVQLEVTSDKGCKNKTNKTIVINPAPVASFSLNPSYGNPPFAVNFTNTSNGALSYVWSFGDGNTSNIQNPTNTYKDTGTFKITLTIKNNLGCINAVSKTVNSLKKIIDVKVQDISAVLKNDFLNITVQLANKGTVDITKLDLYIKVNDGPEIKEEWSGLLLKGGALIHTFKASVNLKDDNHYVCVTAANPNGLDDEDPSNNKLCKGINVNAFQVFELYPNPVKEAVSVTLPLVITKKEMLTITLYDSNGKFVKTAFSEVITDGLQLINISVIGLKSGLYACKIEYGKESAIKKIMLY